MGDRVRRTIALWLRLLARRIDTGCVTRVTNDILPDDVVLVFRGVDPEHPIDEKVNRQSGWPNSFGYDVPIVRVVGDD